MNLSFNQNKDTHSSFVRITPAIAESLLNIKWDVAPNLPRQNRGVIPRVVKKYANEMILKNWDEKNGETIKLAPNGAVLDGQHRLRAIVESGITLNMLTVFNVDPDTFSSMDRGMPRTKAHLVGQAGIKSSCNVSAAAHLIMAILKDKYVLDVDVRPSKMFSEREVVNFCLDNQNELEEAVRTCSGMQKLISPAMAAACFYLFRTQSRTKNNFDQAVSFFEQLKSGIIDDRFPIRAHPIYLLREKLVDNKGNNQAKLQNQVIMALIIKTWNSYVSNKPMIQLRAGRGEPFPKIV